MSDVLHINFSSVGLIVISTLTVVTKFTDLFRSIVASCFWSPQELCRIRGNRVMSL